MIVNSNKGHEVAEAAQVATPHEYTRSYYVEVFNRNRTYSCQLPLKACYHHIRIFKDWNYAVEGCTLRFQDIRRLKPKNNWLKIRMINGKVFHINFVHRFILKQFLNDCVARQFLQDTPYTIKSIDILNTFFKPVYYPNGQSKFYVDLN